MLRGVGLGTGHGHARLSTRLSLAAAVAAPLPVVVATVRSVHRGWVPAGDTALFAIRARDVFSTDPPLVGTWSSRSLDTGTELHHPGPLLFDLLAVPVGVLGSRAAVLIGVALVNAVAVVGIAIVGHRRGGPLLAAATAAVAAGLGWSMGSEVLVEPWNPHSVLLPFLCYLMLVWSVTCGDVWALPWAAGVGSLVLQTHLSYGLLVPVLGAWAVLGLVLELRRRRRADPGAWPGLRRRGRRAGVAGVVVLAVSWAQPLVEQFTSDGAGNLSLLMRSTVDSKSSPIGWDAGTRLVAAVVSLPPFWLRPSFGDVDPSGGGTWRLPSRGLAVVSLTLLVVVLGWCWRDAHRREDGTVARLVTTTAVVVVTALATAATAHPTPLGAGAHQFRWLWPVGAFVAFTLVVALVRPLEHRLERVVPLVAVLASATGALVVANVPASNQGTSTPPWAIPVARDLTAQMSGLEREGPFFVDASLLDPYGPAVMAELSRRDIPFIVPSELVVQYGETRRFDGDNARAVLYVRTGPAINDMPVGARRVALVRGLDDDRQRELSRLEDRISEYLREGRLHLNERGRRVTERGGLPHLERQLSVGSFDPEPLYESRELVKLVEEKLVILKEPWASRFERYADLQDHADRVTVALLLGPF